MRHAIRCLTVAVGLAALASCTTGVPAARDLYAPTTAENCARLAGWLSKGHAPALAVLRANVLQDCPDAGSALASAVERASGETDTAYLAMLADRAGAITHPAIFASALRLADDRAATVESRVAGLLVLAGQHGGSPLLIEPVTSAEGGCFMAHRFAIGSIPASAPLPGDAKRRGAMVVDRIRTDSAEPELLRTIARCVRPMVARGVPPQIDVSAVRLRYFCGNWFKIHNPTGEQLTFGYFAETTRERLNIDVGAGGERMFSTGTPSTVRLYYDGRLIQTTAHGGTVCPAQ